MLSASSSKLPILYSFRRCPYAMRARMALRYASIQLELREITLKNKPAEMLEVSSKGTVPVLVCTDNQVIDESLDIMLWALNKHDTDDWLKQAPAITLELIQENDFQFKPWLDKYKYAARFPEHSPEYYREQCRPFLQQLESQLKIQPYLFDKNLGLADVAIFPFIRQFNGVEPDWLKNAEFPALAQWLNGLLQSKLFTSVMKKYPAWEPQVSEAVIF